MSRQKRVVAIHDISCVGKCSLTVALPILSAAGIETSIIPTAVLSTHTGGFEGFTFCDLTEEIIPITDHWQTLDLKIDGIYTGFLGSFKQLELMEQVFDTFKRPDNIIFVDPVMADNGVMYSIFSPDFAQGMARLCGKADIIIPNITEACFMTGEEYRAGPYTKDYIETLLERLTELGPKKIILTGVCFDEVTLGAASYDRVNGQLDYDFAPRIEGYYHGSGDVFGSAALAALMNGFSLREAARVAVDFTVGSIQRTKEAGTDIRYGIDFERGLGRLITDLKL
ncbi:MAG: pyridoxamine kinase [Syntrophomonadaceae bacterium]|nr:pyridoxamine kinase [Syntrophomonadaceae bacterium]